MINKILALLAAFSWLGLWLTPDQQGQWHFQRGNYVQAAATFHDPLWQGTALYRAGEFKQAAAAFSRVNTALARYNEGNARLMAGQYEAAIACYNQALAEQPAWQQAIDNRAIAVARAASTESKGGDMGDQRLGADDIVFDNKTKNKGEETDVRGSDETSNQMVQALWLRRIQTRPADFLRAKFAYQQAARKEGVNQ